MLLNQLNFIFNLRTVNNNKIFIFIQIYFSLLHNPLLKVFIKIVSLINSGNTALVFIDKDLLIKKHNIIIKRLLVLKLFYFINRFPSSFITHFFITKMIIGYYTKSILFYIIKLLLLILVILKILQLKKHNLKIDFPILELKFNSNYYTYNYLPQYIPNCNQIVLYKYITQLTLRYRQLIIEEIPDISEPIYIANKAEILEDQTTALPLKI